MNKSFSISIGGLAFFIEDTAYESLKNYLDSIRISLQNEEGSDEIMQDVEQRIAELFKERLGNSRQVVNLQDIEHIKSVMGKPQDFAAEDEPEQPKKSFAQNYTTGKQFFRDGEHKILGGVLSGIGNYFGIDAVWLRLLFFAPMFFDFFATFGLGFGTMIIIYFILWIIIPEAKTTSDKLKMQGKPVNFSNIKQSINIDNEEVKENFSKAGNAIKSGANTLGSFLEGFFKVLLKIFLIVIGITFILAAFGGIISYFVGIVPWNIGKFNTYELGDFIFDEKWQLYLSVILIGLAILIPAFYFITIGLRLISERLNYKINSAAVITSVFLWIASIIGLIILGISTASNFSFGPIEKTDIYTLNANSDTITVYFDNFQQDKSYKIRGGNFTLNEIEGFTKDGQNLLIGIGNHLELKESDSDKFVLEVISESKGKDELDAKQNLESIKYEFKNLPNELVLNKYFALPKDKKFRDQDVKVILSVPKGKFIKTKNISWIYSSADGFDDDYYPEDIKQQTNLFSFENGNLICHTCKDKFKEKAEDWEQTNETLNDAQQNFDEAQQELDKAKEELDKLKNQTSDKGIHIKEENVEINIDSTGVKIKKR